MAKSDPGAPRGAEFGYLRVDDYLKDVVSARALQSAFELGLIDLLLTAPTVPADRVARELGLEPPAFGLLLGLLRANNVVREDAGGLSLDAGFAAALAYRDLMTVKLDFANLILPDLALRFTPLLRDPPAFMSESVTFDLFRYDRCFEPTEENLRATRRWMTFTTCLTKYEAGVCLARHDFSPYRAVLDVGGNSGEFMLRVCKAHPGVAATVFDLPVVCHIGREHVSGEPEAKRIRFVEGDARRDRLPAGHDLVTFKSVLHDWPLPDVGALLRKAAAALRPGGRVLVFERAPLEVGDAPIPYSMIPNVVFMQFFRPARHYAEQLEQFGFRDVEVQRIDLEMPFHLITATRTG